MTVTEIGCMGVKPDHNIMDETTKEGQILVGAWKAVTAAPGGPHRVYWGLEVEDPSKVWAFFDFDSVEDHEKFAKSFGGEAVKDLPTILTHGEFSKHVAVTPFPPVALQSAVTEVLIIYFPSDISQTGKDVAAAQLQQFIEKSLIKSSDAEALSYGWGVENDFPVRGGEEGQKGSILISFIGWPSVDAKMKFQGTEGFKENVHLLMAMEGKVNLSMFHINGRSLGRQNR